MSGSNHVYETFRNYLGKFMNRNVSSDSLNYSRTAYETSIDIDNKITSNNYIKADLT